MILVGFGWLACTVRCMSEGKNANREDHLRKVVQDKQENEFHEWQFMATWPSNASSLLNYTWYHSKIALFLYIYICTYIDYIYISIQKNLAKYLIKLDKVHRQSTGLAQTSDSISQVKDVHVLRSFEQCSSQFPRKKCLAGLSEQLRVKNKICNIKHQIFNISQIIQHFQNFGTRFTVSFVRQTVLTAIQSPLSSNAQKAGKGIVPKEVSLVNLKDFLPDTSSETNYFICLFLTRIQLQAQKGPAVFQCWE